MAEPLALDSGDLPVVVAGAAQLVEFVEYVAAARSRPDARSTEIAVGNGIEWTIKIA